MAGRSSNTRLARNEGEYATNDKHASNRYGCVACWFNHRAELTNSERVAWHGPRPIHAAMAPMHGSILHQLWIRVIKGMAPGCMHFSIRFTNNKTINNSSSCPIQIELASTPFDNCAQCTTIRARTVLAIPFVITLACNRTIRLVWSSLVVGPRRRKSFEWKQTVRVVRATLKSVGPQCPCTPRIVLPRWTIIGALFKSIIIHQSGTT